MLPFEFKWIPECDSTSRVLKDLNFFADNKLQALAAAKQTAGVGRLGRRWISSEGNLNFSIGIPAALLPEDVRSIIPLAAGVIVAKFVRANFGVNVFLKWPNDLILDGKKVGGILCEATIQDARMQGVVIGIGINIANSPLTSESLEYPAGSLASEASIGSFSAEDLARKLVYDFANQWSQLTKDMVLQDWAQFGMSPGQIWYRQSGSVKDWYKLDSVSDDGNLSLVGLNEGKSLLVNSSNHEFKWELQMGRRMIVADVGNTRTKLAAVSVEPNGTFKLDGMTSETDGLDQFVKSKIDAGYAPVVHCLSVNPSAFSALQEQLTKQSITVRLLEKKPIRLTKSLYDFDALGVDRWAILELLYYRHSMGHLSWPAIAVSCGTATTIDGIDAQGCHVGGYIMPGVQTGIDALSHRGALLPKSLDAFKSSSALGWPTHSRAAMIDASIESTAAFVIYLHDRLAKSDPGRPASVILTGGYSKLVSSRLEGQSILCEENLVLFGAALLALNGR